MVATTAPIITRVNIMKTGSWFEWDRSKILVIIIPATTMFTTAKIMSNDPAICLCLTKLIVLRLSEN